MFTQLFGNYLLQKGIATTAQLTEAIKQSTASHIKVGSLAIHSGYMTPDQVERVYILQTHEDALFGQLAIREGYINDEQLDEILRQQTPSYLKVGQALVENRVITATQFDELIHEYQTENKIVSLNANEKQLDDFKHLIRSFCSFTTVTENDKLVAYLHLLFNNLIRFIGSDFTPLNLVPLSDYRTGCASCQKIDGPFSIQSVIDMDEKAATLFATRYAGEAFESFDEYCQASLDDFLNLHNGLFLVNMSNSYDIELQLNPPEVINDINYMPSGNTYFLPIIFTFGTVNFLFTI